MTLLHTSIIVAVAVLAGCTASEGVALKDASGYTMHCGPYMSFVEANEPAERTRKCVETFESLGYKQVSGY